MDTPVYLHDISIHDTLSPDTGPDTSLPDPYDTTGLEYFSLEMFWIQYVQAEMSELGVDTSLVYDRYRVVNSRKNRRSQCYCGMSTMSYPHWPPSCYEEAQDQLHCLIGRSNSHRMYLASCWLSFLNRTQASPDIVTLVRDSIVYHGWHCNDRDDEEQPTQIRQKVDCRQLCHPVLKARSCFCLCLCAIHREECPVHLPY